MTGGTPISGNPHLSFVLPNFDLQTATSLVKKQHRLLRNEATFFHGPPNVESEIMFIISLYGYGLSWICIPISKWFTVHGDKPYNPIYSCFFDPFTKWGSQPPMVSCGVISPERNLRLAHDTWKVGKRLAPIG